MAGRCQYVGALLGPIKRGGFFFFFQLLGSCKLPKRTCAKCGLYVLPSFENF